MRDLDMTIEKLVLLTLINSLGPDWNQYRVILQDRVSRNDRDRAEVLSQWLQT